MLWVSAAKSLRALRALRALRPLRVISRYPGMKLVVNSVFRSLPDILNTVIVCVLFYLIFAIIGVQNWAGALAGCPKACGAWRTSGGGESGLPAYRAGRRRCRRSCWTRTMSRCRR